MGNGAAIGGREVFLDYSEERSGGGGGGGSGRGGFGGGFRGGDRAPRTDLEGKTKTLFVRNLPYSIDEDELVSSFAGAQSARLPVRDDGRIKGFGYVEFGSPDEATNAFNTMNGAAIGGREVYLDYNEDRAGGSGGRGGGYGGRGGFRGGRGGDRY